MPFDIQTLLMTWESWGVFDFVLPFLLIFAVVFAVLTTTNILGGNKGVAVVIALVVGLMALRLGFVQAFFLNVFPRLGVAIAVILVLLILTALFVTEKKHLKGWLMAFAIIGAILAVIVNITALNGLNWFNTGFWEYHWAEIIGAALLIGVIVAIIWAAKPTLDKTPFDQMVKLWGNS